ncbi:phosphoglycerate mutase family protein [Ancylostoma caninum]|uniref:Phosphoglycerate mutase family protein n=1 Tax=Ancylostoma caninum TaxID=29170 RepID=A0A368GJF9_ANCCA|nr:phosphoglycerate mutase family protein [Ancylostoma caninum]
MSKVQFVTQLSCETHLLIMGAETSHLVYTPEPEPDGCEAKAEDKRKECDACGNPANPSNENLPGAKSTSLRSRQPKYYNIEDIVNSDMDTMVDMTDKETCSAEASTSVGRKIAVVRHAATMNEVFPEWFSSCVSHDQYTPKDLNHPVKLPHRSQGMVSYSVDPPITRIAKRASRILGKALATDTNIKWDNVISAPELASAQTAYAIAFSTTEDKAFITIDERLYDFTHSKIDFMTPMELMKFDISVKVCNPMRSKEGDEPNISRVLGEFEKVQHQYEGNLIIVVGAASFDVICQRLIGSGKAIVKGRPSIPQLTCLILEKEQESWKLHSNQILPMGNTASTFPSFDPVSYYST